MCSEENCLGRGGGIAKKNNLLFIIRPEFASSASISRESLSALAEECRYFTFRRYSNLASTMQHEMQVSTK